MPKSKVYYEKQSSAYTRVFGKTVKMISVKGFPSKNQTKVWRYGKKKRGRK
jgi:hypothetical protein